jgi:hypothetical protein
VPDFCPLRRRQKTLNVNIPYRGGEGPLNLLVDSTGIEAVETCDTRKCHDAIAAPGTQAILPPRKNARPRRPTSAGAIARNAAVNASRYLGHALRRRGSGCHRRSRGESTMNCIKPMCQSVVARDFDRQRKSRSASPCPTARPISADLSHRPQDKSVPRKQKHAQTEICGMKPITGRKSGTSRPFVDRDSVCDSGCRPLGETPPHRSGDRAARINGDRSTSWRCICASLISEYRCLIGRSWIC